VKITLLPAGRVFQARDDEPVLTAALREHLNLPHSCKSGSCGTCRVRVIRGGVVYPHGRPLGISTEEADNMIMLGRRSSPERGQRAAESRLVREDVDVEDGEEA
jgi:ferredoxin